MAFCMSQGGTSWPCGLALEWEDRSTADISDRHGRSFLGQALTVSFPLLHRRSWGAPGCPAVPWRGAAIPPSRAGESEGSGRPSLTHYWGIWDLLSCPSTCLAHTEPPHRDASHPLRDLTGQGSPLQPPTSGTMDCPLHPAVGALPPHLL